MDPTQAFRVLEHGWPSEKRNVVGFGHNWPSVDTKPISGILMNLHVSRLVGNVDGEGWFLRSFTSGRQRLFISREAI